MRISDWSSDVCSSDLTIRAFQHLADHWVKGQVQLADLAVAQNIPPKFLTVILSERAREGLLISQRGRDRGYQLALSPIDISYGDLVRLTRGSLALVPCAARNAHEHCKNCLPESECRLRSLMLRVRDDTASILDRITLADPIDLARSEEHTSELQSLMRTSYA